MARRAGDNVSRSLLGGNASNRIGNDLERGRTTGVPPTLQKAVVIEVITDPDLMAEEELNGIAGTVNNSELVDIMPINSVVARVISSGAGTGPQQNTILFPFFSSHIMLPIVPGEIVYVIYEDFHETGASLGYWFTRVGASKTVEDANYTHLDRRHDATSNPANYTTGERSRVDAGDGKKIAGPGFPNGANTQDTLTLALDPNSKEKNNPYEQIKKESKAYRLTTTEPVPRWRKRPQELVFQGRNNTLISLGEDRSGAVINEEDARGQAGTVDIVAGRARKTPLKESGDDGPVDTNPRVIRNSRGELETDKAPHRKSFKRKDNPKEGNPDFQNDASRLYVSMQTEADIKFNIKLNTVGSLALPDLQNLKGTFNRAHVVGKTDHIRFIAREDTESGIKGTVLLVREGAPDESLGYFYIDENGQIQIESKKIYLGKSTEEIEPYIRWTEFKKTVVELQAQINELKDQLNFVANTTSTAFLDARGNLLAPIPALISAAPALGAVPGNLNPPMSEHAKNVKTAVEAAKSEKIFGE